MFEVPPEVLSIERLLLELDTLDGKHLWVAGILCAKETRWELEDESHRLELDIGPDNAEAFLEPLWVNEGRRCAVQGALIRRRDGEPFLVVERVVTARSLGLLADSFQ